MTATPADFAGTIAYQGPDATIHRLMPGFSVTFADRELPGLDVDTWTAAVAAVKAARTIAREAPRSRT